MARVRPDDTADRLAALVLANLRPFLGYATDDATGLPVFDFEPPLTAAEQATYADLLALAKFGVTASISLTEYQALKPDLAGLRTYAGIASPTLVQTASAVKAQSRILRALLRDG